jgi:hypothetical protein
MHKNLETNANFQGKILKKTSQKKFYDIFIGHSAVKVLAVEIKFIFFD